MSCDAEHCQGFGGILCLHQRTRTWNLQFHPDHPYVSDYMISLDTYMGELQDVCCVLGLWCSLVSGVGENGGVLGGKINLLFLTMCGTAGINKSM